MNDHNGSVAWSINKKAYRLNRYVERTERHIADSLYEPFVTDTSVNSPLSIQKSLALDTTWKLSVGLLYEAIHKCGLCMRVECACPEESYE
jgi:hypothetical protein